MQEREKATGQVPHPTACCFHCLELGPDDCPFGAVPECFVAAAQRAGQGGPPSRASCPAPLSVGLPFWGDTATGQLLLEEPEPPWDSPGGFNCDEPGLGKTIELVRRCLPLHAPRPARQPPRPASSRLAPAGSQPGTQRNAAPAATSR